MDDLRPPDTWSSEDDAFLRGALVSLRADVNSCPLPEPAFVRARGDLTRRRRLLSIAAGVAAAAIIVGALGFRGLAKDDAAPPPLPASPPPTLATASPDRTSTPPQISTVGTPPVAADLFLSAEDWNEAEVGSGSVESAVPLELTVGSVAMCDPNAEVTPAAVAWMRDTSTEQFTGVQRVQATNWRSDGSTNEGEPAAVVRAMLTDTRCRSLGDPVVSVEAGPLPNSVAVTSTYADGVRPYTDYVGVVAMQGGTNTSTIVITHQREANSASTWSALGRLMDAAARK